MLKTPPPQTTDAFQQAKKRFLLRLTNEEAAMFRATTFDDVKVTINEIQKKQKERMDMMNFTRIKGFLEAMDQLGKVIEVFLNASEFLCFIWGPLKFLLLVASTFADSFDKLLDAYQDIAENIPLLEQYRGIFEGNKHMIDVLSFIYEDVLDFHSSAMRVFAQPTWKLLLRGAWSDFKTRFQGTLNNLQRHKDLLHRQTNLIDIQFAQQARAQAKITFDMLLEEKNAKRHLAIIDWLSAVDTKVDHDEFVAKRLEYPPTGLWIFQKPQVRSWCDLQDSSVSLAWLHGIPGAGKTMLASLIVEECNNIKNTKKSPSITVAYFYCRYLDQQRNTFVAVARSILSQIYNQNRQELSSHMFDECLRSGQSSLTSKKLCSEILQTALNTVPQVYIVIDGVDECDIGERESILSFFAMIVEKQDNPGKIRCLFTSQNENDIKKRLQRARAVQLKEDDNKTDITTYATHWSLKIQKKFELESREQQYIISAVCERAEGMLLFAKLVLENLFDQDNRRALYNELHPSVFPTGFEQAYERIVTRVYENPEPRKRETAQMLLGWVVSAKRPLKWHEIQGARAIDHENQDVEFVDLQLRDHIKDLCGSLVEVHAERISLVHTTAKSYLTKGNRVHIPAEDQNLAVLCLRYLTFECFDPELDEDSVNGFLEKGYYAFQDYAILHWLDHLESWLRSVSVSGGKLQDIDNLDAAVGEFQQVYGPFDSSEDTIDSKLEELCSPFIDDKKLALMLLMIGHARKSRKTDEKLADVGELENTINRIRTTLETLSGSSDLRAGSVKDLRTFYGLKLYKCPRHECFFFHEGFMTVTQRKQHVDRHEKPYSCSGDGCFQAGIGFSSEKELKKHNNMYHPDPASFAWKFPKTKKEPKRFPCDVCSASFIRRNALNTHKLTHTGERPFKCSQCQSSFTRKFERDRHERKVHT